eukprot:TRINITY_DN145_c0_g1_i1.p1 TRINITY_DN145_c0_g1~~TRINITY_DN145_c0_g1_i1.p1  ORF type:complete len:370 (+),score=92.10 TRINITY_DN145_c0_g1_i1:40-1149(+)
MAGRSAYNEANDLFVDENYQQALVKYNEAISLEADSSDYYIKRSNCNFKLQNLTDALEDANTAVKLTPHNANAFYRKGVVLFHLEEYESAKATFVKGHDLDRGELASQFKIWIRKCDAELKVEQDSTTTPSSADALKASAPSTTTTTTPSSTPITAAAPTPSPAAAPVQPKPPKFRHEWYQTGEYVNVNVFAKGMTKDKADIQISERELDITIHISETEDFNLSFNLCDSIVPDKSVVNFLSTKIEIKLKKVQALQWASLENTGSLNLRPYADTTGVDKHSYPSSSKKRVDWDSLSKSVDEEKPEGDAALNKLFQDIYSGGSEEQRRAMMKSYVESGGTVLSTNWEDVGKRNVEGTPPKGMEMHKWTEK